MFRYFYMTSSRYTFYFAVLLILSDYRFYFEKRKEKTFHIFSNVTLKSTEDENDGRASPTKILLRNVAESYFKVTMVVQRYLDSP